MYQIFLFKASHVLTMEVGLDNLRALTQLCFHTCAPVLRGSIIQYRSLKLLTYTYGEHKHKNTHAQTPLIAPIKNFVQY